VIGNTPFGRCAKELQWLVVAGMLWLHTNPLQMPMTEATPVHVQPKRLLDQIRDRLPDLHCSLRTEQAHVYWLRQYVPWSGKRHPRDMEREEVGAGLTVSVPEGLLATMDQRWAADAMAVGSSAPVRV
jgi:hypothetical protein